MSLLDEGPVVFKCDLEVNMIRGKRAAFCLFSFWIWFFLWRTLGAAGATMEQADRLYQAKEYQKAAEAYLDLSKAGTAEPGVWFKLGLCYHEMGQLDQALEAYKKAESAGVTRLQLSWRMARIYAKNKDADQALAYIKKVADNGFAQPDLLKSEADFAGLRDDSRYQAVLAQMEKNAHPCDEGAFRDFDFWVGEWDVTAAGATAGTSSIQQILNQCVIFENYTGQGGYAGKSLNIYDTSTKEWKQFWVDNSGSLVEFHGQYADGKFEYHADTVQPDGKRVQRRMIFVKMPEGKVRQYSEQSSDGGKTWSLEYDLLYTKKS